IGFAEMLTREKTLGIDPARRQDYARLIRQSGEHLLSVVNAILDVAQIDAGHFTISPVAFSSKILMESCQEMMTLRAEQAGVALSVQIAENLPEVVADERAIRQIILNLLSNAIKFTERGGMVTLINRIEDGQLAITVADSGIGISETDLKQIGNPF